MIKYGKEAFIFTFPPTNYGLGVVEGAQCTQEEYLLR